MTFQETALCGAQLYYQYLCDHSEKGVAAIGVSEIQKTENAAQFQFKLVQHPRVLDSLHVEIRGVLYEQQDIRPTEYDKYTRTLTVYASQALQKQLLCTKPSEIRMISDVKFLVKRVGRWYSQYADRLAHPPKPAQVDAALDQMKLQTLSADQEAAIHGILSQPFTYIWGAPGTGKTRLVLSSCVLAYLRAGKRILITAPTNNAVEQTLYGVISTLEKNDIDYERCLLRLGVASSEFAARYPAICEDRSAAKRHAELSDELLQQQTRQKDCQTLRFALEKRLAAEKNWDTFCECKRELLPQLSIMQQLDVQLTTLAEQRQFLRGKQTVLQNQKMQLARAYSAQTAQISHCTQLTKKYESGLLRLLFPKRYEQALAQLSSHVAEADSLQEKSQATARELEAAAQRFALLEQDEAQLQTQRKAVLEEACTLAKPAKGLRDTLDRCIQQGGTSKQLLSAIDSIEAALQQQLDASAVKDAIPYSELLARIQEIEDAIKAIRAEMEQVQNQTASGSMASRQIIAATIDTCIGRLLPDDALCCFAHVFLDEASYCSLIKAATLTAYHAPLTFLGDDMQLSPICEMPDDEMRGPREAVAVWAQSALYLEDALQGADAANGYRNALAPAFCRMKKYELSKTYRFGAALASILSQTVYNRLLEGSTEHETQLLFLHAQKIVGREKRTNTAECKAICRYLDRHREEDIGILTPYKNQRNLLASEIKRYGCSPDMALTVHGSQGREWDTVLFSVVDTTDKFLTSIHIPKSNGCKLINTAVSRAKKKLIIVCDCEYWMQQTNELIGKLLAAASPEGENNA